MELKECLNQLPEEALTRLAQRYEVDTDETQLSQVLLSEARDSLVPSLKEEQLWTLKLICLCRQGRGLIVEQCHQTLNRTARQWRRNAGKIVQVLMDSGLVFTKRQNYRQVYFVPQEIRDILVPKLSEDIWERCRASIPGDTPVESDELKPLRMLYLFLSYLNKRSIKLTQAGGLFKRAQRNILNYLGIEETLPAESPIPVTYPPSLAMLYYYCRSRRLVENSSGRLFPSEALRTWLATSPQEKLMDFFSFWQEAYLQQDADLETLYGLVRLAPPGRFLRMGELLKEMEGYALGQSWQGLATRAKRFFFIPLQLLGMMDIATIGGEQLCRLNRLGRDLELDTPVESGFFVQPNYELLVPKNLHPDLLWTLETLADLHHPDQLMVYRLQKHSIHRALNSGMTIQEIQEFLIQGAKHQLPSNILSSLHEWGATFGRLELLDVVVLHCDNEQLAREIQASERLATFIEGKLTNKHLLVKRELQEELVAALTDAGYMPKS